ASTSGSSNRGGNLHDSQTCTRCRSYQKAARDANIPAVHIMMSMNPEPGLRERKKQRTRETIARAARELFAERGYHTTTLPDIAEAADVSTRTIFSYFPSKEDILFSDFPLMKETLGQALAERPEGEEALETVRKFILSLHEFEKSDLDEQ